MVMRETHDPAPARKISLERLILLPFRLLGFAVSGVLELVRSIILLPARLLRGRQTV